MPVLQGIGNIGLSRARFPDCKRGTSEQRGRRAKAQFKVHLSRPASQLSLLTFGVLSALFPGLFDFAQSPARSARQCRDMETEHGHTPAEIAQRLRRRDSGSHLKDVIYGAIDGTVTTFAIVAGVEGAGLSTSVILALGAANILADGFSMAAGNFAGTRAELEDRNRTIEVEKNHLKEHRTGELEELRQILQLRGLEGDVLDQATRSISKDEARWIDLMLVDEYGLSRTVPNPGRAALATFLAFLAAGAVPLLPFVLGAADAFEISIIATLCTFFLIGAARSRWSLAPWWRSGLETLLIGAVAAAIAYLVASLFR